MSNRNLVLHELKANPDAVLRLDPHATGIHDWANDGQTSQPGHGCNGIAASRGRQCAKDGVVELLTSAVQNGGYPIYFVLCGSHFLAHRRGRPLLIWLD